jgi:hypothetical protein
MKLHFARIHHVRQITLIPSRYVPSPLFSFWHTYLRVGRNLEAAKSDVESAGYLSVGRATGSPDLRRLAGHNAEVLRW